MAKQEMIFKGECTMKDNPGYEDGDIVRLPGDKSDLKFHSIMLAECYGYENEVCKDSEGDYIHIIKKHDVDGEIETNIYQIGEFKISNFCNRKVIKLLAKAIFDNGFTLIRTGSDNNYIYYDVIKIVGDWLL